MPTSRITAVDNAPRSELHGLVLPMAAADAALQERLFQLFGAYYRHVERAAFERDQREKDWLLLLTDDAGAVRGFTTAMLYRVTVAGREVRAVFSGNTIIERACWGAQELVNSFGRLLAEIKYAEPQSPLYWYLICSGYRTYMYLPLFYHQFYPRCDQPTPAFEAALIDTLGGMKFGAEYAAGVVHVSQPRECLDAELAIPAPHKLRNPHIRYFVQANPGYLRGDELVCVAEYSVENTRGAAQRTAREYKKMTNDEAPMTNV